AVVVSTGNPAVPTDIYNSSFTIHLQVTMPSYLKGKTVSNLVLTLTTNQTASWTELSSYTVVMNGGVAKIAGPITVQTTAGVNSIDLPSVTFNNCTGSLYVTSPDPTYTIPLPGQGDNGNGKAPFQVPLTNATPTPTLGAAQSDSISFSMTYSASGLDLSDQTLTFDSADLVVRDMIFGDNQYFVPNNNQWAFVPPATSVARPLLPRVGATSLVTPSGAEFDIAGEECTANCAGLQPATTSGSRADVATLWSPNRTNTSIISDPLSHAFHTATLLTNGTILVAGGTNGSTALASAEIFDPATGRFTATATPMLYARQQHTASLLPNGRVLLAGGFAATAVSTGPTNLAEIYYPDTKVFLNAPPMISSHSQHTAITLPNGNVFIAGGYKGANQVTGSAEIYSSTADAWVSVPDMTTATGCGGGCALEKRAIAAGVQLQDGRIMLCGGTNQSGILSTCVAYDPAANTWSALSSMPTPLQGHTATLLFDGRVLVAGGDDGFGETTSSYIYDPYTGVGGTWSIANPLHSARVGHNATLLPNGTVMVSGGVRAINISGSGANALQSMEFFVPDGAAWFDGSGPAGSATEFTPTYLLTEGPRAFQTTTLAPNGQIYFIGGANGSIGSSQSASFYSLYESMYFTVSPDLDSINQPSIRQSTIAATTASPFLPGASFNVTGLRFRGGTEAAGGGGAANASFSSPRLLLAKVDGSGGSGSNSTPGFIVDLTTRIYANPANQATLNTSLTVTLPNNNALPYGWYNAWVAANDIHTAQAPFVQVGPPKPAAAVAYQAPFVNGISSITFNWTGLALPCDGYNVYAATTGVFITTIAYVGTGLTSFTQTGLAPNTTDSVIIAGYTVSGDGPLKASATSYTLAAPPTSLSVSSVTFNSINLQWSSSGNSAGTIYEISQSTDWPAPFSQSVSTPVPFLFGTISTNVVLTQLLPNTTYTYRIQAYNFDRIPSDFSMNVTTQTRSPVSGVQGKALTSTSIIWSWNSAGAVTYNVYNATTNVVLFSTTSTSFTDSGLAVNASRVIAVTAVTGAGEGPLSASATVFTLANVPVPLNPAVTSLSTYSFTEGWTPTDGNPLGTVYHVTLFEYLDSGVVVTSITPTGFGLDTLALPKNLTPGVRYDSYVTAINGDAIPSAALLISTYTLPARPVFVAPTFFSITPTSIGVKWDTQSNSTKTVYEVTYSTDPAFVL
ncbi:MAG: fibronectin type III domain-containing protein, partial [Elusimicrobia bacterium]|nr:fibronectin type III domain-containing protein [Elusimicrobiota bacterium]